MCVLLGSCPALILCKFGKNKNRSGDYQKTNKRGGNLSLKGGIKFLLGRIILDKRTCILIKELWLTLRVKVRKVHPITE
jgi:hypothetical protein